MYAVQCKNSVLLVAVRLHEVVLHACECDMCIRVCM